VRILIFTILALVSAFSLHAADTLTTAINGDTLSINGGETKLGAGHWAKPEESWRTVGELAKTALPPGDKLGHRDVMVVVTVDDKASWGALKTLLLATSNLGVPRAEIRLGKAPAIALELPGAEEKGDIVEFPLSAGAGEELMTENGGKKFPVTAGLIAGMLKQVPKGVVAVRAPLALPAGKVARVLDLLTKAKATFAFLPVREQTGKEAAEQKEAKDAVDRALEGTIKGLSH
jgi:hypothetical protein